MTPKSVSALHFRFYRNGAEPNLYPYYRERCYVMKAEEDDLSNISNHENSYFARHSPSSFKKRTRQKRKSKEVPEFEGTCKNVRVYYLDYGYSEKVFYVLTLAGKVTD